MDETLHNLFPLHDAFAKAAVSWPGDEVLAGRDVAQTRFHGPAPQNRRSDRRSAQIRLSRRNLGPVSTADIAAVVRDVVAQCAAVEMAGLQMINLQGFAAFVPIDDATALRDMAAHSVRNLNPYRAGLTEAEIARRHPSDLRLRQRELLAIYGYPYMIKEFIFICP